MSATVKMHYGAIAQLVERLTRTHEVSGSTPLSSTVFYLSQKRPFRYEKGRFFVSFWNLPSANHLKRLDLLKLDRNAA